MKSYLFLLLFFLLAGACHRDTAVEPSDWFYQRWHLVQSRKAQDAVWTINKDTSTDTEFRSDGALIYRSGGAVVETPCCASSRYERDKTTIHFMNYNGCPFALCSSLSNTNASSITSLSQTSLELVGGDWISQYTAVH